MVPMLASIGVFSTDWAYVMLMIHLLTSAFALGAVTHHWWALVRGKTPALLAKYAGWMAFGYSLSWVFGVIIYPTYNVLVRKPPIGVLETLSMKAVGFFEIKEHFGTFALIMIPWLLFSARNFATLSTLERRSYIVATWVFTFFVYYSFISGGMVTAIKSF